MKQFVRALNTDSEYFQQMDSVLSALSFRKIRVGVFDEPQIRTLVRDQDFMMNDKERGA